MKNVMTVLIIVTVILACAVFPSDAWALDWKSLHEEASEITLQDALDKLNESPHAAENQYLLALMYLYAYENGKAKEIFLKILKKTPQSHEARWGLGEVLRREHKTQESEKLLEEVIEQKPEFSPAHISLGYIRFFQKQFNEAARLSAFVINQGKKNADIINFVRAHCLYAGAKGMIAHFGGPISKAINGTVVMPHLRTAETEKPNEVAVLFGIGSYYLLIPPILGRDIDRSIEYLKRAIAVDSKFPDVYVRLGQAYRMKGDEAKYEQYLDKALELDPQHELALDIKNQTCDFICVPKSSK